MVEKIKAQFIYEILGRPPEYIKMALQDFISKFDEQKGIKVNSKQFYETKPCEEKDAKDLFTTFAEVEMTLDNLEILFSVVHSTLPSSVEIIEPKELIMENFTLNSILADLTAKVHKYDEITKILNGQKEGLLNVIKELQEQIEKLRPMRVEEILDNPQENKKDKKSKVNKKSKKN